MTEVKCIDCGEAKEVKDKDKYEYILYVCKKCIKEREAQDAWLRECEP